MQHALFVQQDTGFTTGLKCSACELSKNSRVRTNCMAGAGPKNAEFMFVGYAPGQEDDGIGFPMTGSNGRLLRSLLSEAGFNLNECYFTNCLKCCTYGKKPTKKMWQACREHFLKEYEEVKPKFVVSLGAEALDFLTGQKGVKRLCRKAVPSSFDPDVKVYPLRQPAMLQHAKPEDAYAVRRLLVDDLIHLQRRKFLPEGTGQYDTEQDLDYRIARTEQEAMEMVEELRKHDMLSCDLETTNLGKPTEMDTILAIGFSFATGVGYAFPFDVRGVNSVRWWSDTFLENELKPAMVDLIKTKNVFGQNFIQYDQMWLRNKLGIEKLDIDYDTKLAHYCINEDPGTGSLESQAMEYTSMSPWKTEFVPEDVEKLLGYLCKDVDATWRLREICEPMLNPRQQWLLRSLLIPLSQELFEIEYEGVNVDLEAVKNLDAYLTEKITAVEKKISDDPIVRRWEMANNNNFNPGSPAQLSDILSNYFKLPLQEKTDTGAYKTGKDILVQFDDVDICRDILQFRGLNKLRSVYVKGTMDRLRDGKLHTSFNNGATVTGRLTSSDPNLQQLPREDTAGAVLEDGSQIKKMFVPKEGYAFVQADLSQAELRTLASLSGDETMIGIFREGLDIHTATAAAACGVSIEEVTKAMRSAAKKISFGIVYGMQEDTLIEEFIKLGNTRSEAEDFLRNHKKSFPKVWQYMDDQESIIRRDGMQTTYFGRSRRYDVIDNRAVRQAYNFPIQSMTSDVTLMALIKCAQYLRENGFQSRVVLTVHDSIIFEVLLSEFWNVVQSVCSIMENADYPWVKVPMVVDAEAGFSWGSLKKLDWKNMIFESKE